jgi:NAD(P)-dependent dehydrogenase (short-subunit alcohol dehydrogenase family)
MTSAASIPATLPRAALVTGAAQRIGRAIALALADAGFAIALHCHTSAAAAAATCEEIRRLGRNCVVLRADLADEA